MLVGSVQTPTGSTPWPLPLPVPVPSEAVLIYLPEEHVHRTLAARPPIRGVPDSVRHRGRGDGCETSTATGRWTR